MITALDYIQIAVTLIYIIAAFLVGVFVLPKQYRQSLIKDKLIPFRQGMLVFGIAFFSLTLIGATILSIKFIAVAVHLEQYVRTVIGLLLIGYAISLTITAVAIVRLYHMRLEDEL